MADDIATLGIKIDSAEAERNLRNFEVIARRTGETVDQVAERFKKVSDAAKNGAQPIAANGDASKKTASATEQLGNEAQKTAQKIQQIDAAARQSGGAGGSGGLAFLTGAVKSFVAAFSIGAILAGINTAISKISELGDKMLDFRLTADVLQGLRIGAAQAGVSQDQLNSALSSFSDVSKKARINATEFYALLDKAMPGAANRFAALAGQEDGQSKRLDLIRLAMSRTTSESSRLQLAQAAFNTQNERTIDLLSQGGAGFENYIAVARRYGILMDGDVIKKSEDARKTLDTLAVIVSDKLKVAIVEIIPDLQRMLPFLERVAVDIRDFFASFANPAERPTATLKREVEDSIATLQAYGKQLDELKAKRTGWFGFTVDGDIASMEEKIKKEQQFLDLRQKLLAGRASESSTPSASPAANDNMSGFAAQAQDITDAWNRQVAALSRRNTAMEAEALTVGQSDAAHEKLRTTLLLEDFLYQKSNGNVAQYNEYLKQYSGTIEKAGDAAAATAEKLARARVSDQINFGRQTTLLTQEDVSIAQQLRGLYPDVATALGSVEAQALRVNSQMRQLSDLGQDVNRGLFVEFNQGLRNGKTAWDSFRDAGVNALGKISDKLMSMAADNLWKAAFGGNSGGGLLGFLGLGGGPSIGTTSATAGASSFMMGGQSFPMFADGGTLSGGWGVVGERGPELINVHSAGVTVIPNHISRPYLPGFADGGMLSSSGNVTRGSWGRQDNSPNVIINNQTGTPVQQGGVSQNSNGDFEVTLTNMVTGVLTADATKNGPISKAFAARQAGFSGS